uniref:Arachidonate 12-lipoxygenase, 12R-type-like n=1 Tax=Crassostrea virginica TaxID=6565 RepID=A0A8B8AR79_CRAVI|nr:arachidonate 12-lipoxygenase, 12R-type-like [Crassostrea virginica]
MGSTESHNVSLPQNDDGKDSRRQEIKQARSKYELEQKTFGLDESEQQLVNIVNVPPMLKAVPWEEKRSCLDMLRFVWTFVRYQIYQYWGSALQWLCQFLFRHSRWTIDDMVNQFSFPSPLKEPKGCKVWRTEAIDKEDQKLLQRYQADYWFAWERMNGVTRNLIKQIKIIPASFAPFVNNIEQDHPYLGNISLQKHAEEGNIYIVDLSDVAIDEDTPVSPIAFFVIWNKKLMPVAIVLDKRNPDEKVHTPANKGSTEELRPWVNARMWFGMADASYHESITHLGFTHLLMDGVSVCMHRNISSRHPIYKLLHPHFRYLHTINKNAIDDLINPGGYVDRDMYFDREHMLKLIATHNENWTYSIDARIRTSLEKRGVMDLPGYFFRDDALSIHSAIRTFVEEYATHYYRNDQEVQLDEEIQAFREELTRKRTMTPGGGCGMNGIPELTNIENLVDILTNFIYINSVEHSATNFPQYEQYGFSPNFPAMLHGLPTAGMTDLNINIPTKREMLSTIKIMKVLTLCLTNSLGDYEKVYLNKMDESGRTFVQSFQKKLIGIEADINQRNMDLEAKNNQNLVQEYTYEWLRPKNVLNSISI